MNERREALEAGHATYSSAKPCRRGHTAERYTSTGQCKECLKFHMQGIKSLAKAAKARRNVRLATGMVEVKIMVPRNYTAIANDISDLLAADNYEQNITVIKMLNRHTLTADQVKAQLDYREGVAHAQPPMRHNDAGYVEVFILNNWYLGDDLRHCLQGQAETCDRVFSQ